MFHGRHCNPARGLSLQRCGLPYCGQRIGTLAWADGLDRCCNWPTFRGKECFEGPLVMNEYWILAFVITPALAVILGWSAVFLQKYQSRRQRPRLHPGE